MHALRPPPISEGVLCRESGSDFLAASTLFVSSTVKDDVQRKLVVLFFSVVI